MSKMKVNRIENTSTASGGLDIDTSGKVRVTTLADSAGNNNSTPAEIASGRAKAFVSFDGTGSITEFQKHNVSSVTDQGNGKYYVNLSISLNTNALVVGTVGDNVEFTSRTDLVTAKMKSATQAYVAVYAGTEVNPDICSVVFFDV